MLKTPQPRDGIADGSEQSVKISAATMTLNDRMILNCQTVSLATLIEIPALSKLNRNAINP